MVRAVSYRKRLSESCILTWNCEGMFHFTPYIEYVIATSFHWNEVLSRILSVQATFQRKKLCILYRNAKEFIASVAKMVAVKKASEALCSCDANMKMELEVLPSGELGKENCSDTNDVTEVCNKDHGGDNVGAMFQREKEWFQIFGIELPPENKGTIQKKLSKSKEVTPKRIPLKLVANKEMF